MTTEPAGRLLLLALDAIQREASLRVQAIVEASASEENRNPQEWQFDFSKKLWVKIGELNDNI